MAHMTFEPAMFELFDTVMSGGRVNLEVEEIALSPHSRLIGMAMTDAQNQLLHSGMVLVALKRGEQVLMRTAADLTIKRGDVGVITGLPDQLATFRSKQGAS
ncbi:TrkA C-terminal domain-containing protein [Ktedonospora formicarum]|uniref:RCK C-terminal domain-containing protein n=1 Tax=Ktedonospora formicarum TaxID=2778364 RepID=A0A8J3MS12_9CHLR|nr:TrkA C-terminal domain-containing protein [Ktedonospora formicarum]GHO46632.1 hypothetical protein KSX_47950 [Ktedonospora formicarum]